MNETKETAVYEKRDKVFALLDEAAKYHVRKAGIDPHTGDYIYWSPFCPKEQVPVGARLEPVITAPGWNLDEHQILTVNSGNSLVLNSKNMLILDLDCGERRFNKWIAHENMQDVLNCFRDLAALDARRQGTNPRKQNEVVAALVGEWKPLAFLWSEQTWRLYATPHGVRAICTSRPFPLPDRGEVYQFCSLCQFLGCDPLYTQKCIEQKCYRARLTPKCQGVAASHAATLWDNTLVHPDLQAALSLHDLVAGCVEMAGYKKYALVGDLAISADPHYDGNGSA